MLLLTICFFLSLFCNVILVTYIWLNGNAEKRLAAVIRHQANVIHNGQQVIGQYHERMNILENELRIADIRNGQKTRLIAEYEKIILQLDPGYQFTLST